MNYCIYLKRRKNKLFCKLRKEEITFSCYQGCEKKEYKEKNSLLKMNNNQIFSIIDYIGIELMLTF